MKNTKILHSQLMDGSPIRGELAFAMNDKAYDILPKPKEKTEKAADEALSQAITEVVDGARICLEKDIDLTRVLDPDFNMQSWCGCVLAKNHASRNYFRAKEHWNIQNPETLGFSPSSSVKSFLYDTGWDCITLYNVLWRTVGEFVKTKLATM